MNAINTGIRTRAESLGSCPTQMMMILWSVFLDAMVCILFIYHQIVTASMEMAMVMVMVMAAD